jgi:hypothetical protein
VEVAVALKEFAKRTQIKLEGHHNVTIATGRPTAPNKAVIDQLKKRFYDMRREENLKWNSMFGVGTDGKYWNQRSAFCGVGSWQLYRIW